MKIAIYADGGALLWAHEWTKGQMQGQSTRDPQTLSAVISTLHAAMEQALGQSGLLLDIANAVSDRGGATP